MALSLAALAVGTAGFASQPLLSPRVRPRHASTYWDDAQRESEVPAAVLAGIRKQPWRGGLEPAHDVVPTVLPHAAVRGRIPKDFPTGTLYRNGPGRVRIGESLYRHWFDGDGLVSAVSVDREAGTAAYAMRYVNTERYAKQQEPGEYESAVAGGGMASKCAWTPAKNNAFRPNLLTQPTNPANTAVLALGGKLYALCEGGPPVEIDARSLETIDDAPAWAAGLDSFFSAHPKVGVDEPGALYNFGLSFGASSALCVFKLEAAGGAGAPKVVASARFPLERLSFAHDMFLTEKYVIVVLPPFVCPTAQVVATAFSGAIGEALYFDADVGNRVVVLRRDDLSVVADATATPAAFSYYHGINAYEQADGSIRLQVAAHNGPRVAVEANFKDMCVERTLLLPCDY